MPPLESSSEEDVPELLSTSSEDDEELPELLSTSESSESEHEEEEVKTTQKRNVPSSNVSSSSTTQPTSTSLPDYLEHILNEELVMLSLEDKPQQTKEEESPDEALLRKAEEFKTVANNLLQGMNNFDEIFSVEK